MHDITLVSTTSGVTVTSTEREVTFVQVGVQGPAGPSAHGELSGLALDQHTQYHTDERGDARYAPLAHASDTDNPHGATAAQVGADAIGTAASAVAAHAAGTGVHAITAITGLQTALDGKAPTSHDHAGSGGPQIAYNSLSGLPTLGTAAALDVGTTANKVLQLDGTGKLPAVDASQLTNFPVVGGITDHGALTGLSDDDHVQYHTDARGDARYSVMSHNHAGTYEEAGAVATHSALTTSHGISAFGATLVDDVAASYARTTLGLGGSATLNIGTTAGTVAAGDDSRLVAATPAETTTTIGALINGATPKTTPVDADSLGLSDSESGGILREFTWASLKAALNGIFVRLSGIAGGQTLNGGTGAGDALTLQSLPEGASLTIRDDKIAVNGAPIGIFTDAGNSGAFVGAPVVGQHNCQYVIDSVDYSHAAQIIRSTVANTADSTKDRINILSEINRPNTTSSITGDVVNMRLLTTVDGSQGAARTRNLEAVMTVKATGVSSFLCGISSKMYHSSTGSNSAGLNSLLGGTYVTGGGSVGRCWGTEGICSLSNGSTATRLNAVGAAISAPVGTNVPYTVAGVNIGGTGDEWSGGGNLANVYALWIGATTYIGTNNWSIFNESPGTSYFAGSIGIGLTVASAKVHVLSTTAQLRLAYDAANYASFTVSSAGVLTIATTGTAPALLLSGDIRMDKTIMAVGTTGSTTNHKTIGSVNFAAGASSLVVTSDKVSTNSVVVVTVGTNDSTLKSVVAVAAAGKFTLYANAAATAETRVNFHVFN